MNKPQKIGFWGGILSFLIIILFTDLDPGNYKITLLAAAASLMAIWWMTEAIPLAATSLVPVVLFPLSGIISGEAVAGAYMNSTIFLFLGGFILAIAMEKWNLHKRIALKVISIFGKTPSSIIYGIMAATAFLSMWISNTAAAVMMLPIGLSIIYRLEEEFGKDKIKKFSTALMLAIAYSCSLGGIATLIGTPPNLALVRIFKIIYPSAPDISFGSWMLLTLPAAVIMLVFTAFLLTKVYYRIQKDIILEPGFIKAEYKSLGKMTYEEKVIAVLFSCAGLLWIFRTELNIGIARIPGWSQLFPNPEYFNDGMVAVAIALLLFFIPVRNKASGKRMMVDTTIFNKIPWGIILLFGGGFALAEGFTSTGLSGFIGQQLTGIAHLSPLVIILIASLTVNFLTELTSNTAVANMILPIAASIAAVIGMNPLLLMIPVALASSMAFMLPVATPPNTVIFASERVRISQMASTGILLNITSTVVICLLVYTLGAFIFGIDVFPEWAR